MMDVDFSDPEWIDDPNEHDLTTRKRSQEAELLALLKMDVRRNEPFYKAYIKQQILDDLGINAGAAST